jgi:hypothetical protein
MGGMATIVRPNLDQGQIAVLAPSQKAPARSAVGTTCVRIADIGVKDVGAYIEGLQDMVAAPSVKQ